MTWTHTGFAQQIRFGSGALDDVAGIAREAGGRRLLLVTNEGRLSSPDGERLSKALGRELTSTFAGVQSHVPAPAVQAAVQQARRDGVDAVVSFGGGSCADLAKAVCYFTEREAGTPGANWLDRPALPHVAIPTTYSGAELTPFFGMTDPATRRKSGGGGPTIAPVAAVYDPDLTVSTPGRVSAETGMNALAHCVECAYSSSRTPEAEAIALAGIRLIATWLPAVVDDPVDLVARTHMFEGAVLAGRALQNAAMGVHHGLAQLVGGRTGIAHGLANAIILAHAMRFNAETVGDDMRRIGEALGDADDPAAAVERLVARLGLPSGLSDSGVTDEDIEAVVRLSQSSPAVQMNPRSVSEDDARSILDAAF